jgi:putative DNA primase/helicase
MMTAAALARALGGRPSGSGWEACCPAHEDRTPSLSIGDAPDGKVLVRCHAGCSQEEVIAALKQLGLWQRKSKGAARRRGRIVAQYDYSDEGGGLLYQVVRFDPKDFCQRRPDGGGGWVWSLGDTRRVLYRLPAVARGVAEGRLIVQRRRRWQLATRIRRVPAWCRRDSLRRQ